MSLKGKATADELRGKINGLEIIKGYSAYEIALIHGFEGTEEEWLESLNYVLTEADKDEIADIVIEEGVVEKEVSGWLDEHPEATTTVQDGVITEPKIAKDLLDKKMKYSHIDSKTVTLQDGYFIYTNCTINAIPTETVLTGEHIFINCEFDSLFIRGGEYEFKDCTFNSARVVHSTARFYACVGKSITLTGNCHNSVIDGCKLTSDVWTPIIVSGGVADNVKISNNTVINNAPTGDFVYEDIYQTQCINTHGIINSVIENNHCKSFTVVDTEGHTRGGTVIDVSGHSDTTGEIRSYNNVIRDNVCDGGITIYCAKDIVCQGNIVSGNISISGNTEYKNDLDYGVISIQGNVCNSFHVSIKNNPRIKAFICGNTTNNENAAILFEYELPENASVHYFNNAQKSNIIQRTASQTKLTLPMEFLYIGAGTSVFIPPSYIVGSEISTLTKGSFFNGGLVKNETAQDRWLKYCKINTQNGGTSWWTQ